MIVRPLTFIYIKLFEEIATHNMNKPIALFLDNTLITEATVDNNRALCR